MYFEPSPILVHSDETLEYDSGKYISQKHNYTEKKVEVCTIEVNCEEKSLEEFSDVEISPITNKVYEIQPDRVAFLFFFFAEHTILFIICFFRGKNTHRF